MTDPPPLPPLIGESRPFLEVMEAALRVAPLDRPVLVIGERGTGKELVAARLHFLSSRWNGPLVALNCAALAESLLEAELFGHEAGAFTGAARRRVGRFERADGGTLFLDEIANAPATVQEKVLRVVEYGQFERVGSSETTRADVRLVAAANVDLPAEAAAGRFRADLLDRLAFDVLTLPPLRARREDIPLLTQHFARGMAVEMGWSDPVRFSDTAAQALLDYQWPGNIRELKNVVERAVYRWPDPDRPIDTVVFDPFDSPWRPVRTAVSAPLSAPPSPSGPTAASADQPEAAAADTDEPGTDEPGTDEMIDGDLDARIAAYEVRQIEAALAACRYNQSAAAEMLGLTYHQLRARLKKHGLQPRRDDDG